MKKLLLFLVSIRRTYYLYIGNGDLIALKHFIDGYIACLGNVCQLNDLELYEQMCAFIDSYYQFDRSSCSIYEKIQKKSNSKQEAFTIFFDLLDRFISDNNLD